MANRVQGGVMRVFVLGHRGMLGHVVARYLAEQGFEIATSQARYEGKPDDSLVRAVIDSGAEWVINAIGKSAKNAAGQAELFLSNTILPVHIKSLLRSGQKMIHASSDAVFSGKKGNYHVDEERDANDLYGLSKLLAEEVAEPAKCWVIRTSIIGPGLKNDSGLMSWFLSQKGTVNGFTNHYWNGITTLEWAKICVEIIRRGVESRDGIVQAGSPDKVSKFELLGLISEIWPHTISIQGVDTPETIDRTIKAELTRAPITEQLEELRQWWTKATAA